MISRTVSRTAHITDHRTLLHLLARCDGDSGAVGIQGLHPAAVVDFHMVSTAAAPWVSSVGNGHSTVCRREDGRALWGRDVCAVVVAPFPGERILPIAKRRGDRKTLR